MSDLNLINGCIGRLIYCVAYTAGPTCNYDLFIHTGEYMKYIIVFSTPQKVAGKLIWMQKIIRKNLTDLVLQVRLLISWLLQQKTKKTAVNHCIEMIYSEYLLHKVVVFIVYFLEFPIIFLISWTVLYFLLKSISSSLPILQRISS